LSLRIYDSFALLKLFQKESGYQRVARLLGDDRKADNPPLLQIINFGEIIYRTKKDFGDAAKLRVIRTVVQLGFRIISARSYCSVFPLPMLRNSFTGLAELG
jgi:hypothetical protein